MLAILFNAHLALQRHTYMYVLYTYIQRRTYIQCTVNGINYEKLQMGGGSKVNKLEIFFFGFPRVVGLQHFPNLTSLCVINQKISRLSGLESCTALQELWVCEGQIEVGPSISVRWLLLSSLPSLPPYSTSRGWSTAPHWCSYISIATASHASRV